MMSVEWGTDPSQSEGGSDGFEDLFYGGCFDSVAVQNFDSVILDLAYVCCHFRRWRWRCRELGYWRSELSLFSSTERTTLAMKVNGRTMSRRRRDNNPRGQKSFPQSQRARDPGINRPHRVSPSNSIDNHAFPL